MDNIVNATGPMIIMPYTGTLYASKHGSIPLPSILSPEANIDTIVPGLKSYYLLSLGQLCEGGCNVLINKKRYTQ